MVETAAIDLHRWATLRGRTALVFVGALGSAAARAFAERLVDGDALPLPTDAIDPEHADVLIVIGRVSHKLAPALVQLSASLPKNARVLAFDDDDEPSYAATRADAVIDVDVLVRGLPPDIKTIDRALQALFARRIKPVGDGAAEAE